MKVSPISVFALALLCLCLPACNHAQAQHHEEHHKVVVTSPVAKDVVSTQEYVCQIHSRRHIEVCALERGYLEEIRVNEGQMVKRGDTMFKIFPAIYQAKLASAVAEAQLVQIEVNNTKRLFEKNVVSNQELALAEAKLAKAQAEVKLARTELDFTEVKAPFDGIIDRLHEQVGSLVEEGDVLTTLSDNSVMWVYFNVPEARYIEYKAELDQIAKGSDGRVDDRGENELLHIELVLANGEKFSHTGAIGAIEADFNNETGNIAFRADFPNPDGLLRFGQTGTVLIHRVLKGAIVIPQGASYEILDKRYVYVVGEDGVVHQREIVIQNEMEDVFVIKSGLAANDKIVLEGVRQVHDGDQVEFEFRKPEEALANLKHHAE
jgi:membrane fusion protein (multidrug efflux system)